MRHDLQFVKDLLDFRPLGEILVQVEEVFEEELIRMNRVAFAGRKTGHVEGFFHAFLVLFVLRKHLDDAAEEENTSETFPFQSEKVRRHILGKFSYRGHSRASKARLTRYLASRHP